MLPMNFLIYIFPTYLFPPEVFSVRYDIELFKKGGKYLFLKIGDTLIGHLVLQMTMSNGDYFPTCNTYINNVITKTIKQ